LSDKLERQAALAASVIAGQARALDNSRATDARAELAALLGPERLRAIDEAVLEIVRAESPETGTEPEPLSFMETLAYAKAARHEALVNALLGRPAAEPQRRTTGFDGGARESVPAFSDPLRDHDELIVDVVRSRAADRGARY
jgi:hypothetical protein